MKNRVFIILVLSLITLGAKAQVTLPECYDLALVNYPLIAQRDLIEQSRDFSLRNASTAYLPQFGLSAKATFQSAVTTVPIPTVSPMPRDQYQVVASVNQSLWDGGATRSQKLGINAAAEVDIQRLEVELYTLNERIDNLFFGIMMLDEQLQANDLLSDELGRNLRKVQDFQASGIANSADIDAIRVEILINNQRRAAIVSSRLAYVQMLSAMVGVDVASIVKPEVPTDIDALINRPELSLFDAQVRSAEVQKLAIRARNMPKLGLFAQGAYGNPGLDMLKAGFTTYAIGGANLSWNFSNFYTSKRDRAKIDVQIRSIELQRETFLYNTSLQTIQIAGELQRIDRQIDDDDEIILLRGNIKRSAQAKLEGGTTTVTDMLREVTAENIAIQTRAQHSVERLMYLYSLKTKLNF